MAGAPEPAPAGRAGAEGEGKVNNLKWISDPQFLILIIGVLIGLIWLI
jgi:hypothetical protein